MSQPTTTVAVAEPETQDLTSSPGTSPVQASEENRGTRQSMPRILAILAAHDAGGAPKDIADTLGIDVRTVKGVLERYGPDDARAEAARNLLASNALQSVQDWIHASKRGAELGKHQAAKELLLHAKVIEPLEEKQQGPGVQIIIGMAGQPAGPDPLAGAKVASIAPSVVQDGNT